MKSSLLCVMMVIVMCSPAVRAADVPNAVEKATQPKIEIAFLLDTSSSMSGLIDQARTELWSIVNEFVSAQRNGQQTELRVALYEYGKNTLAPGEGYIRQIVPFTTDLDKVSEELFVLKTNGGEEYCGWVIKDAVEKLDWSGSSADLKVIFIAGNERFSQGPVDYYKSCQQAAAKGIIVNTILCGSEPERVNNEWENGAVLADGKFLSIDQNKQVVHIPAPQDKEIAELSVKLNDTYIPYGAKGSELSRRQSEQDKNASVMSAQSVVQRAVSKSSNLYQNSGWDLVDAVKQENIDPCNVRDEDLPENMRKMSAQERKGYVEAKAKERETIQEKIQQLNQERVKFTAEEMKKQQGASDTLGSAAIQAITNQAKERNFTLKTAENKN